MRYQPDSNNTISVKCYHTSSLTKTNNWWLYWWDRWLLVHKAPLASARQWFHVCLKMDSSLSLVNVSMNGGPISSLKQERKLSSQDLRKIDIHLGVPPPVLRQKYPNQFNGLITNINIYRDSSGELDIQKMSSNPCQFAAAGDLLAWEDTEWEEQGEDLQQINLESSEVCDENNLFSIPLVLKLNWIDANKTCHILNNGTISEMRNSTEVQSITSKMSRGCDLVWTPYVFDEKLQDFGSSNTGEPIGDLSWYMNAPSNGKFVAVSAEYHFLLDYSATEKLCVACNVQKRRVITLWGVCDQSLLGMGCC